MSWYIQNLILPSGTDEYQLKKLDHNHFLVQGDYQKNKRHINMRLILENYLECLVKDVPYGQFDIIIGDEIMTYNYGPLTVDYFIYTYCLDIPKAWPDIILGAIW